MVTIPAEDVTMGDWHGTGYIVANPEIGAGEYMICGGLNGGALTVVLTIAVLCACFASVAATTMLIAAVIAFMGTALTSLAFFIAAEILLALLMVTVIEMNRNMLEDYMDYMFTGNLDSALSASEMARRLGEVSLEEISLVNFLNTYMKVLAGTTGGGGNAGGLVKEGLGKISGKEYTVTQTGVDAVYYTHELKEAQLVASGIEQSVAHDMALQYYEVSPYRVYHPDVIRMKPEWWSDGWFKFWNIER